MSAPKCGRSAAIWGEIGLQERLVGRILSSSKTACINSRWAAVVQTFPRYFFPCYRSEKIAFSAHKLTKCLCVSI